MENKGNRKNAKTKIGKTHCKTGRENHAVATVVKGGIVNMELIKSECDVGMGNGKHIQSKESFDTL